MIVVLTVFYHISPQLWTVSGKEYILSTAEPNWGLRSLCRRHTNKTLSNVFPFITDAIGYTNTNITFSARDYPTTRLAQYLVARPGAIRVPHYAEQIRRRHRSWAGLRPIQTSGGTGSGQPHSLEKDSFLDETVRGLNAVLSKGSSGDGNGQRGNGAMDTKEGIPRTAVFNAILVAFAAGFWLKRTDHALSSFLVAIGV